MISLSCVQNFDFLLCFDTADWVTGRATTHKTCAIYPTG